MTIKVSSPSQLDQLSTDQTEVSVSNAVDLKALEVAAAALEGNKKNTVSSTSYDCCDWFWTKVESCCASLQYLIDKIFEALGYVLDCIFSSASIKKENPYSRERLVKSYKNDYEVLSGKIKNITIQDRESLKRAASIYKELENLQVALLLIKDVSQDGKEKKESAENEALSKKYPLNSLEDNLKTKWEVGLKLESVKTELADLYEEASSAVLIGSSKRRRDVHHIEEDLKQLEEEMKEKEDSVLPKSISTSKPKEFALTDLEPFHLYLSVIEVAIKFGYPQTNGHQQLVKDGQALQAKYMSKVGFSNIGNTCWMNTLLQMLFPLTDHILKQNSDNALVKSLQQLIRARHNQSSDCQRAELIRFRGALISQLSSDYTSEEGAQQDVLTPFKAVLKAIGISWEKQEQLVSPKQKIVIDGKLIRDSVLTITPAHIGKKGVTAKLEDLVADALRDEREHDKTFEGDGKKEDATHYKVKYTVSEPPQYLILHVERLASQNPTPITSSVQTALSNSLKDDETTQIFVETMKQKLQKSQEEIKWQTDADRRAYSAAIERLNEQDLKGYLLHKMGKIGSERTLVTTKLLFPENGQCELMLDGTTKTKYELVSLGCHGSWDPKGNSGHWTGVRKSGGKWMEFSDSSATETDLEAEFERANYICLRKVSTTTTVTVVPTLSSSSSSSSSTSDTIILSSGPSPAPSNDGS